MQQLFCWLRGRVGDSLDTRSFIEVVRVMVILTRTVVGDSDCLYQHAERKSSSDSSEELIVSRML